MLKQIELHGIHLASLKPSAAFPSQVDLIDGTDPRVLLQRRSHPGSRGSLVYSRSAGKREQVNSKRQLWPRSKVFGGAAVLPDPFHSVPLHACCNLWLQNLSCIALLASNFYAPYNVKAQGWLIAVLCDVAAS